ncbi:MAG: T9SS type A sorting domain-containing protein, partial [Ignavibacteriaceae bacterium]
MRGSKYNIFYKNNLFIVLLIIFVCLCSNYNYSQSFTTITPVENSTGITIYKPQSKVWTYGGYWWAVIPVEAEGTDPAGTYLWRLDGITLTKLMKLSDSTKTFADAKCRENVTHILLVQGIAGSETALPSTELVSIQYKDNSPSPPTYEPWSARASNVPITLDPTFNEAATIDIDSQGRMWLASDADNAINVRWSDSPYNVWSTPTTLNTGHNVVGDDICVVTAFDDDKIGVFWSNQSEDEFQFRYHLDNNPDGTDWEPIETAADGNNIADDHINLAVHSNGNIYAAVKTTSGSPDLGLLVRNAATGNWASNMYTVNSSGGTRPIALLNEIENKIYVIYHPVGDGDIVYKSSSLSNISFPSSATVIDDSDNYQDLTSTKQSFTNELLFLYNRDHSDVGGPSWWHGTKLELPPFPVELSLFNADLLEDKVLLNWRTETEVNNFGFYIERSSDNSDWLALGFVEGYGNSNSPKQYSFTDHDIKLSGKYYYRLKQIDNDGTYEYFDVVTVEVGVLNNIYLAQNYPNPFNPETRIEFTLPEKQLVSLRIYNTLGELKKELINEEREAGSYTVNFDASNLPSGVYIYSLQTSSFTANRKMTLLK